MTQIIPKGAWARNLSTAVARSTAVRYGLYGLRSGYLGLPTSDNPRPGLYTLQVRSASASSALLILVCMPCSTTCCIVHSAAAGNNGT
jgi:hypothetical protein